MSAAMSKEEKYLYCAHVLLNIADKQNIRIFALTSSVSDPEKQTAAVENILEKLRSLGKKVLLLDMNTADPAEIQKKLDSGDLPAENDLVFVRLLPVSRSFSAIYAAKKCGGTLLLEKYTRTMHHHFDELIETLRRNEISVSGVITY